METSRFSISSDGALLIYVYFIFSLISVSTVLTDLPPHEALAGKTRGSLFEDEKHVFNLNIFLHNTPWSK